VEISKSALKHNLKQYNKIKAKDSQIAPVLKSNAYGHGLIECANLLKNEPIWGFCTVNLSESLILRNFGFKGRLLVLSFIDEDLSLGIKKEVAFSVYSYKFAQKLSRLAAKLNKKVKIHLKVETGTGRLGLLPENLYQATKKIIELENLEIEGIFTHLADSENADWQFTNKQIKEVSKIHQNHKKELNGELIRLIKTTSSGKFYNDFVSIFKLEREEVKVNILKLLYSKNEHYKSFKRLFSKAYPLINEIIIILKGKNHKALSIEMQKIESYIFIDEISKRLCENGITPLTIHDSIIVEKERLNQTKQIIESEFTSLVGLFPTFKVKSL